MHQHPSQSKIYALYDALTIMTLKNVEFNVEQMRLKSSVTKEREGETKRTKQESTSELSLPEISLLFIFMAQH
jgi:hypothetical protein